MIINNIQMKTFFLQVPVTVDTSAIDLTQTSEPIQKTLSILELITSGGLGGQIIMISLAVLSILTVYFFWERIQVIRSATKLDTKFMNKVKDYLSDNKVESVVDLCDKSPSALAKMIAKGVLQKMGDPEIQDVKERGNLYKLEFNLSSLATSTNSDWFSGTVRNDHAS